MLSDKSAVNYRTSASSNKFVLWKRRIQGTTAIEYALIATGVAVTIAAIVFLVGDEVLANLYQRVADAFDQR